MEEYKHNKNDKTEDIRVVNDFRDELERIKQKLASDFTKYSELDKIKHKEKLDNINQAKTINNNKKKESKYNFFKIPTMEELRMKYGLGPNKKKISQTESNKSTNANQNLNKINNNNKNNQNNFMKKIEVKKLNINDNNRNNSSNNKLKNSKNFYFNSNLTQNNQNISSIPKEKFMKKFNNLDIDKDIDNKSNLTFKNDNINKHKFKAESNLDDINIKDNIDNYIKKEKRKIESPNRLITINNSNNNTSLILNSKLDQQIKLIDEKSENNRLQEEKTQMKIRQIENKLQLDERLTHNIEK